MGGRLVRLLSVPGKVKKNPAVSTVFGILLVIALTVALAAIISVVSLGLLSGYSPKSAYIVAEVHYSDTDGYPVVFLRHIQGDAGYLSGSGAGYPLAIQVSSGGDGGVAVPYPVGLAWSAGKTLSLVRTGSGYHIATDISLIPEPLVTFPGDEIQISVIDTRSNLLVFSSSITLAGVPVNMTPSLTPTPTPTVSPRGPGFSVGSWIRFTSPPAPTGSDQFWATVVVDGNTDRNRRYHLQHSHNNDRFEFAFRTARMAENGQSAVHIQSSTGPVQNQWYYLTGVYNQTEGIMRLYVNGVEAASRTVDTSGIAPSPGFYQVGGQSGIFFSSASHVRRLMGDVSGVSALDQAMNPFEIQSRYQAGSP